MNTAKFDEIDALREVSESLDKLDDKAAAERVVRWAWGKYIGLDVAATPTAVAKKPSRRKPKPKGSPKSRKKEPLSIVKDLDLKPDGGLSLAEFVEKKRPSSHKAKIAVCAYYLSNHANIDAVTLNHIYTSFKWLSWRLPNDLRNMVAQVGSAGWMDSGDAQNLRLTTMGENYVEHDLPKSTKTK